MGNNPCCCKDDLPNVEVDVKIKDIYCCDNIKSSCCIRTERRHHHHHKTNHKTNLSITELKLDIP